MRLPREMQAGMNSRPMYQHSTGLGQNIAGARVNMDGALVSRPVGAHGSYGYSQPFRNGALETVKVHRFQENQKTPIGHNDFERQLADLLRTMRAEYGHLDAGREMVCMVSILGAEKATLGLNTMHLNLEDGAGEFDRRVIALPDVLLTAEGSEGRALRPMFDLYWQSAGIARSPNFDAAGDWTL